MLNAVSWFVIGIVYNTGSSYMYAKLTDQEIEKFNVKNFLFCVFISILYCLSLTFNIKLMMTIFKITLTTIFLKRVYNHNLSKTLITTFLIYVLFAIGEFIFVILFIAILRVNQNFIQNNCFGILVTNIIILYFAIIVAKNRIIHKIISNIIKWYSNNNILSNFIMMFFSTTIILVFILYNYSKFHLNELFLLVNLFFIGIIVFIIGYFKEKTDNNRLVFEYDSLIDYVKTYEELLESKNKNQHEYMNQLILIKGMLNKNNKKARDYIDRILDVEENSEENIWINKFKNIPNGGLKGLLYYKVSDMVKNGISVYIEISDSVNNKKLNKYLNDNLDDISKIIGVYLDNAKDAIMESDKKYLIIEADCDKEKFSLSISNTFKGNINLNRLDEEGYSKKGKGHGYGLSLVKDIINKHKDITQAREMNGMYYVQTVSFKYKNK